MLIRHMARNFFFFISVLLLDKTRYSRSSSYNKRALIITNIGGFNYGT